MRRKIQQQLIMQKDEEALRFVDSHNHMLDYEQGKEVQQIIAEAYKDGIVYSVTNTTRQTDYSSLIALQKRYPYLPLEHQQHAFKIIPCFGIHPCFLHYEINNPHWKKSLQKVLADKQFYGIGQIGLDYRQTTLENNTKQKQAEFFHEQLELSFLMNRSVTVHCVRAHGEMLKIFKRYSKIFEQYTRIANKHQKPNLSESELLLASRYRSNAIIMHSYGGSKQITKSLLKLKWLNIFFSLSLKRSEELCEVIPIERLLLQTDAPYQNDVSLLIKEKILPDTLDEATIKLLQGKNKVSYVRANLGLSKFYGLDRWQFARTVFQNSLRAFHLK